MLTLAATGWESTPQVLGCLYKVIVIKSDKEYLRTCIHNPLRELRDIMTKQLNTGIK